MTGGQLISTIAKFCRHGDATIAALMRRILCRTLNPLYNVLHSWIYDGQLNDRYRYVECWCE